MEDHDDQNQDHDQNHNVNKNGGSGTPPATPRWNPTKEQINMLESLYRQGIRTPSAEQIQQITTRLRAFGHIEGKNVFYWFQNHKARQRQKQKQENMAYINRFLHRSNHTNQSIFPPSNSHHIPCPNVVCGPYYVPVQTQSDPIGALHQPLNHQSNKLPLSIATRTTSKRSPKLDKFSHKSRVLSSASGLGYDHVPQDGYTVNGCGNHRIKTTTLMSLNNNKCHSNDQETLQLFPLCPSDILRRNEDRDCLHDGAENMGRTGVTNCEVEESGSSSNGCGDQLFYDFFSR